MCVTEKWISVYEMLRVTVNDTTETTMELDRPRPTELSVMQCVSVFYSVTKTHYSVTMLCRLFFAVFQ